MRKPGVIATVGDTGKVSVTAIVRDAAIVGNTPKGVRTDFFYGVSAPSGVSRSRKGLFRDVSIS